MDLEVVRRHGYLHIRFFEAFSVATVKHAVDLVADACKEEPCSRILFDSRSVTGEMPVPDRFDMGRYAAESLPESIKVAVLARADQISPDGFFETVARNRDLDLRVFSDLHEATEWLKE